MQRSTSSATSRTLTSSSWTRPIPWAQPRRCLQVISSWAFALRCVRAVWCARRASACGSTWGSSRLSCASARSSSRWPPTPSPPSRRILRARSGSSSAARMKRPARTKVLAAPSPTRCSRPSATTAPLSTAPRSCSRPSPSASWRRCVSRRCRSRPSPPPPPPGPPELPEPPRVWPRSLRVPTRAPSLAGCSPRGSAQLPCSALALPRAFCWLARCDSDPLPSPLYFACAMCPLQSMCACSCIVSAPHRQGLA
mmetsp:Transcript_3184/g.9863  ORF Transcript_3184/g.9863 Transcript_3184/m.9863 type:complete len:253 (+) Transcript_3184:464-1222(+)